MQGDFIGRSDETRPALATLYNMVGADPGADADETGVLWDVTGMHGIGKSALLQKLRREATALDVLVIPPDNVPADNTAPQNMALYAPDSSLAGDCGPGASAEALWSAFRRSCAIMQQAADVFVRKENSTEFAQFTGFCDAEARRAKRTAAANDVRDTAGPAATRLDDHSVRAQLRVHQQLVDDAFVEAWTERPRRSVLITLDPFDEFVDDEFGQWLVRLCLRLPDTLTVLARVRQPDSDLPVHDRIVTRPLAAFTPQEVQTFLESRRQGEPLPDLVYDIVYDYTDGHPGGLELAAKLINRLPAPVDPTSLRRELDRLGAKREDRWAAWVSLILGTVPKGGLAHAAVQAAAVARRFDDALLGEMLRRDPRDPDALVAFRALREFVLAQVVGPEGGGEGRREGYRLPEFIRLSVVRELISTNSERWLELNARAAAHYLERIEGDGTAIEWRRYERPEWQADKRQWLYHSGQLLVNRSVTRAQFCLVFFEAFYWWGCYHEFAFVKDLVEDWERTASDWIGRNPQEQESDRELANALKEFHTRYPKGHQKRSADWDTIFAKLLEIQKLCGLGGRAAPGERRRMARTNALVKVFLAHSRRYRDPADPAALRYYDEALFTIEKLEDRWLQCWIVFEIGDLALEAGRLDDAGTRLRDAVDQLLAAVAEEDDDEDEFERSSSPRADVWDHELAANLFRAAADLKWARGEPMAAAVDYGHALEHAYWMQGDPTPPDPYTVQFYAEIVDRIDERAGQLRASADQSNAGDAFLTAVVGHVHLRGSDGARGWAELAVAPDPDEDDELNTRFMSEWLRDWNQPADFAQRLRSLLPADA